jgi:hypothetical protein
MTKQAEDSLSAALRHLDAAPQTTLTEAERQRADKAFARIVATQEEDRSLVARGPARRRRSRVLMPAGLLAAAGSAAAALVFGGSSALASWTPTPETLTSTETSAAADTCRADLGVPLSEAASVAERRGDWTYVLVSGASGEGTCLMRNSVAGQDPTGHEVFGDFDTDPRTPTSVARDGILEAGSSVASVDDGLFHEDWLTWTYGYVGADVTGITVHTPQGVDVEASVENGRFAAWWPSQKPSSKNPEAMGAWSYTVTLASS